MKVIRKWDSLSEFVDYANGPTDMTDSRASRDNYGGNWHGSADWNSAMEIAFSWKEGADAVERMRAQIKIAGMKPRREVVSREAGPGVVSMGHFMAGHPQPYSVIRDREDMRNGKGKIVKVMLNMCVSGGIGPEILERRGAGVLALCDALERAGRRTEIYVVMANTPGRNRMEYTIRVKAAHQRFSLPTIAFAVAHPSMFRRLTFSAMERENAETRSAFNVGVGYGRVGEMQDREGYIYLGGATLGGSAWKSEAATQAWVIAQLSAQGITLK